MKKRLHHTEEILNGGISGFHVYDLREPAHLIYVSESLCHMVGRTEGELMQEGEDGYAALVHPSDKERYAAFLKNLSTAEPAKSCDYRLLRSDGTPLYVRDTVTVKRSSDGSVAGYSVLTDITDVKNENRDLRFLSQTIPCGFLKYTCEKQPKITYINRQMMDFLRFPEAREGELDYLDLFRDNIFLMIPMEERRRFSLYLNRVYSAGVPLAGEITLLRCDGTRAHLFGWVTKCVNEEGVEEFQSVCIDVTEQHHVRKAKESKRYLKALADVYDHIFEYDFSSNTVKCLYSHTASKFKWLENIPVQMEDATEEWIADIVVQDDREKVSAFIHDFLQKKLYKSDEKPPQITYKALSTNGQIKQYSGLFLKMDDSISLYCCRCIPDTPEAEELRTENVSLKENMQELVMRFTDGIAAFEVNDDAVKPLYASDNICEFFGFTKEEWLPLMEKSTPLRDFIAHSEIPYETFAELLNTGEAEFTYYDLTTETERQIKAICSQKAPGGSSPRYVLLYNVEDTETEKKKQLPENRTVSIRTFGYFDVFVGDRPIAFRNKKSKELFALLVDRRGGYISSEEAIGFLWEDEPVSPVTLARYRKVALRLKNILEEYGISDVVESVDGARRLVPERVQCDLYDYLSGKEEYAQLFKGSYLTNYSWGETTLAELTGKILY